MCIERPRRAREAGLTLIEMIVFMLVIGVGVLGLINVSGVLIRVSPEPMLLKQQMSIADSLLTEVLNHSFTFCDPDDDKAATAMSTDDCTGGAAASQDKNGNPLTAPTPTGEVRTTFDNVADYGGLELATVSDITGGFPMDDYSARIAVERIGGNFGAAAGAALRVTVTVSHAGQDDYAISGYRFRYAPN